MQEPSGFCIGDFFGERFRLAACAGSDAERWSFENAGDEIQPGRKNAGIRRLWQGKQNIGTHAGKLKFKKFFKSGLTYKTLVNII